MSAGQTAEFYRACKALEVVAPYTNITLNLVVGTISGTTNISGITDTQSILGYTYTYSQILSYMQVNAANNVNTNVQLFTGQLPSGTSISGTTNFTVATIHEKMWGLRPADDLVLFEGTVLGDGNVSMGTGVTTGEMFSAALIEISHTLGRYAGLAPYAFTRFTGVGTWDFTLNNPSYFSMNNGTTNLANWDITSTGNSGDTSAFLYPSNYITTPAFTTFYSLVTSLQPVDIQLLNALGFQ